MRGNIGVLGFKGVRKVKGSSHKHSSSLRRTWGGGIWGSVEGGFQWRVSRPGECVCLRLDKDPWLR